MTQQTTIDRQPRRQRGLSLISLIIVGGIVAFLIVLGLRITPAINEYLAVDRDVQKASKQGGTVTEIRNSFDKMAQVDDVHSITGKDLDITKDGEQVIVNYSYSYSVPVLDKVHLVIDFAGSTGDRPRRGPRQPGE